jgi:hypothetical protein
MVDENIFCRKKGCGDPKCQLHHHIPKSIGGTDKDGRVYLCEKHHNILHLHLLKVAFFYVPDDKKDECRKAIEKFGRDWVGQQ